MLNYQKKLEKLLEDKTTKLNWQAETECFKTKFLHLQIERLIHLLVTLTVGLAMLISSFVLIFNPNNLLFILDGILIILFFSYLLHYRKLENTAQSWYKLLDKLKNFNHFNN